MDSDSGCDFETTGSSHGTIRICAGQPPQERNVHQMKPNLPSGSGKSKTARSCVSGTNWADGRYRRGGDRQASTDTFEFRLEGDARPSPTGTWPTRRRSVRSGSTNRSDDDGSWRPVRDSGADRGPQVRPEREGVTTRLGECLVLYSMTRGSLEPCASHGGTVT